MLRVFLSRVLDFLFRRRREERLSEEVDAHLDFLTDEYIARGLSREDARLAARRAFGGVDRMKTIYREQRGLPAMDSLMQDVRYAARVFAKDRRFTLAAITALALGIGANTTAFTFVNAVLLRQMPLERPDRLMTVFTTKEIGGRLIGASYADYKDWGEATRAFSQLIVSLEVSMNVTDEGLPPERYWGSFISYDAFRMLGRAPTLGRDFTADDDRPDSSVAIIAHSLWKGRYGSDPTIIGRIIRVNERPLTIIGVMPSGFHFMTVAEVWRPSSAASATTLNGRRDARVPYTWVVGRLADDVTAAQASAEMSAIGRQLSTQYPETNASAYVTAMPLQQQLLGPMQQMFLLVMVAVAIVLLIACVNVANLLLARGVHRSREMALRISLGATRWRVVRQLLVESLMLSIVGGTVGFALATYGVRVFGAMVADMMLTWQNPPDFFLQFSMDRRVYLFTAGTCLATAVVFGLVPALHISKANANDILKDGGRGATMGLRARYWTGVTMVAQLALTLLLLTAAAVVARNFEALYRAAQVTDTSDIVTMRLSMSPRAYPTPERIKAFFRQLDQHLSAAPELTSVTIGSDLPFVPILSLSRRLAIEARPLAAGDSPPTVSYLYVGPRYFETFRLPMRQGRPLDERDGRQGQEGAVINERFASMFFPRGDALGQRIKLINVAAPDAPAPWYTIVGVSPTVPHNMLGQAPEPVAYVPVEAEPILTRFASIAARSSMDRASVVSRLRREMAAVDPELPGYWVQTVDQILAQSRWMHGVFGLMLGLLGAIALTLSSVGLYAVTAHGVAQRAHEVSLRMALGASTAQVVRLFVVRTLWQIGIGLSVGLAAIVVAANPVQSLLMQIGPMHVGPRDPATLALVGLVLVIIAATAGILPARRAARLDPVVALRDE